MRILVPLGMGELLDTCRDVAASDATLEWLDDAFLLEHKVQPWMQMPLWIPESDAAMRGMLAADISRALAAGLKPRRLEDTIRDTLAWAQARPQDHEWRAGLPQAVEESLLRTSCAERYAPSAR